MLIMDFLFHVYLLVKMTLAAVQQSPTIHQMSHQCGYEPSKIN